jgi:hypothetical protein
VFLTFCLSYSPYRRSALVYYVMFPPKLVQMALRWVAGLDANAAAAEAEG